MKTATTEYQEEACWNRMVTKWGHNLSLVRQIQYDPGYCDTVKTRCKSIGRTREIYRRLIMRGSLNSLDKRLMNPSTYMDSFTLTIN